MPTEHISVKQGICILMLFIFGSSVVMGVNTDVAQDSWIALLIAAAGSIPIMLVYARLIRLNPGMGLCDMLETLLGKVIGKVAIALMAWYALHLGALVLRNFSEFIKIVAMPETPQLPIIIMMMLVTTYMAKSGVETLGRWALCTFILIPLMLVFTILLSLNVIDLSNLQPVMSHSAGEMVKAALMLFAFPFAEVVVMLTAANCIRPQDSPYKLFLGALLWGALIMVLVVLRNIAVLGAPMMSAEYFPSYAMARVIKVGNFLSRIEVVVAINFVIGGIVKISLCLLAATRGVTRLFGLKDYRKLVMPMGLLLVAICSILYENTMDMFTFLPVYQYYALLFQVVIPVIVWIAAEINARKKKRQGGAPAQAQQPQAQDQAQVQAQPQPQPQAQAQAQQ